MTQWSQFWVFIQMNETSIIRRVVCMLIFTVALFTKAKTWKQPKCLSTYGWIKKWNCGAYKMEYYSATEGKPCRLGQCAWHYDTWNKSGRKDGYCMITLTVESEKKWSSQIPKNNNPEVVPEAGVWVVEWVEGSEGTRSITSSGDVRAAWLL